MNLYCDNYATCNGWLRDHDETYARTKGWHIFHGTNMGGGSHEGVLCPRCVSTRRRALDPAPPLQPGQQELFVIEAIVDVAGS
jgi:hypothetical protein